LIKQQQDILATNGENQRKRENLCQLERQLEQVDNQLKELTAKKNSILSDLSIALKSAQDLQDQSTAELETSINNIEELNRMVRANLDKDKAEADALDYADQYNTLTAELEHIRKTKTALLNGADLPMPGLSVVEGELTYNGHRW